MITCSKTGSKQPERENDKFVFFLNLFFNSSFDGTVRVWHLPNRTHQFLEQTCIFEKENNDTGESLGSCVPEHLSWSSCGKFLAASLDNIINIWEISGTKQNVIFKFLCKVIKWQYMYLENIR